MDAGRIAVRVVFAYLFMLALVRSSGKRSVAQGSALDFVLALIVGDLFDDLFWGEASAAAFVAAAGSLTLLHVILAALESRFAPLAALLQSAPRLILSNGEVIDSARAADRLGIGDIAMMQRANSIEDSREVREMYLEPTGRAGILLHEWAREAQKRDLPQVKAAGD